jgi:D-3-phosphoglycerate dehydrogenase
MKIVLAEKVSPATVAVLREEPGWLVITHDQFSSLVEVLGDADALVVRSAVQVDDALMAAAPKLRVIGRAGVGVDNIDAAAATRRGIVVMNTPGANAIAVAELTLALMLALARELPRANAALHAGRWEKKTLAGSELRGKTLGILGLGRIGLEVAKRARVFGMTLIGNDPFVTAAVAREHDVRLVATEELFRASDYLSLHVGLTPQTHGIVNAANLTLMKKTARIINCARGELIDVPALVAALNKGELAGAALDVFEQEPLRDSPLFGVANVLLTPHIAGSTGEAQEAVGIQIAEQVRAYLKLGVVQNAVNSPSLSHEQYLALAPFAAAAERLGSVLAQLLPAESGGLESITIGYCGALADAATEMVRNAAVAGVLGASEGANRINAQQVAAERGVRVHEEKLPGGGSALSMTLHTREGGSLAARAGVAVDLSGARLLQLEGIAIEAPLEGTLLVVRNSDVPGVIGTLGTVIGEHGINIANFALGRAEGAAHGTALAVIQIDGGAQIDGDAVPALLRQLRAVEAVHEVRCVQLPQQASPLQ